MKKKNILESENNPTYIYNILFLVYSFNTKTIIILYKINFIFYFYFTSLVPLPLSLFFIKFQKKIHTSFGKKKKR